jgi:hypothetical protein
VDVELKAVVQDAASQMDFLHSRNIELIEEIGNVQTDIVSVCQRRSDFALTGRRQNASH